MVAVIKRNLYFLISKHNWIFLFVILVTVTAIFMVPVSNYNMFDSITLGMSDSFLDKRYIICIMMLNFYFIWLACTLFLNGLRHSKEFMWLRMSPVRWLVYQIISIFISILLLHIILYLVVLIVTYGLQIAVIPNIMTYLLAVCIRFTVCMIAMICSLYLKKIGTLLLISIYAIPYYSNYRTICDYVYLSHDSEYLYSLIGLFVLSFLLIYLLSQKIKYIEDGGFQK